LAGFFWLLYNYSFKESKKKKKKKNESQSSQREAQGSQRKLQLSLSCFQLAPALAEVIRIDSIGFSQIKAANFD
jgi:hypothetical protein